MDVVCVCVRACVCVCWLTCTAGSLGTMGVLIPSGNCSGEGTNSALVISGSSLV